MDQGKTSGRPARVLYVTYDGLTDPLGESQVLPYVLGLADRGHRFHVLSFDKRARFEEHGARIRETLRGAGVDWTSRTFTEGIRLLAKPWDAWRIRRAVGALHGRHHFDLIHCRSYVPVGAVLALDGPPPYVFDMRGFWVDERREGGIWPDRPPYGMLYRHFKRLERRYLASAAGVVSLTHAAVEKMQSWPGLESIEPVVIPCSVDLDLFTRSPDGAPRRQVRTRLGISPDVPVIGYIGSVGTWYLLDDMLRLMRRVADRLREARFLFVTTEAPAGILSAAGRHGLNADRLHVTSAVREEMPAMIEAMDASVFFIRPSYAKTASSPTKLGELMAMGVPCITNAGVGDVDRIVEESGAGLVVPDLTDESFHEVVDRLDGLLAAPRGPIRAAAERIFNLDKAVDAYDRLYRRVLGRQVPAQQGSRQVSVKD